MVVMMPRDHLVRPRDRGLIREGGGLRTAIHDDTIALAVARAWQASPCAVRDAQERCLALPHDNEIDAQLAQCCPRRRRAVRSDGDKKRHDTAQTLDSFT